MSRGKRTAPGRFRPSLVPYGASGGFVVTYPAGDAGTLRKIRLYQQELRSSGWLSRIEYALPDAGLRLYVFRPDDLPYAAMNTAGRYGNRR
jgi:hypothetical protein